MSKDIWTQKNLYFTQADSCEFFPLLFQQTLSKLRLDRKLEFHYQQIKLRRSWIGYLLLSRTVIFETTDFKLDAV